MVNYEIVGGIKPLASVKPKIKNERKRKVIPKVWSFLIVLLDTIRSSWRRPCFKFISFFAFGQTYSFSNYEDELNCFCILEHLTIQMVCVFVFFPRSICFRKYRQCQMIVLCIVFIHAKARNSTPCYGSFFTLFIYR